MPKSKFTEFDVNKFPAYYKKYMEKEELFLKKFLKPTDKVIDIGCGIGRFMPMIVPFVKSYVGIDIDRSYIKEARKAASKYKNATVLELDATRLSSKFALNTFDKAICAWNTIGCMKNGKKAMHEISKITRDSMLFSVNAKGALKTRIKTYKILGIKYTVNKKTETIYSDAWTFVKAYNKKDIENLCKGTGFLIKRITPAFRIGYIILLKKE